MKRIPHVRQLVEDYRHAKLPKSLALLYSNNTIGAIGKGLLALFLPVFFYLRLGASLTTVVWLYIFSYASFYILVIPAAQLMNKIGIKRSIMMSVPFNILFYVCLYNIDVNPFLFAILAVIAWSIARALYWTPYHTSFAKFSHKGKRGRQMSLLQVVRDIIFIFVPIISAFIITGYGFDYLFILVLVIELSSIIPLTLVDQVHEKFEWSHAQTYKNIFKPKHRKMLKAYFGDGIQSIGGVVVWPLFIWLLLEESFQAVGLISAMIIFVTLIMRLILGDYIDKHGKQKLLNVGSVLYSIGWLVKIFVASAFHVFLASVYHNISAIVMRAPFDASMYDTAADWGHYADEFTVIRELALTFGRILGLITVLVLLIFLPLNITFIIAAVGSLLLTSFTHDRDHHQEHGQVTNM